MPVELITKQDLLDFKYEFFQELTSFLNTQKPNVTTTPELMKNSEIKKYLNTSASTIERLKKSGQLPFTRISGTIYFKKSDVDKLIEKGFK